MTIGDWKIVIVLGFAARIGWELADLTWEILCAIVNAAARVAEGIGAGRK